MPTRLFQPASLPRHVTQMVIEEGCLTHLPTLVKEAGDIDRSVIICDEAVKAIAKQVQATLPDATILTVPSGEASKSLQSIERLTSELLRHSVSRKSLLIAIGGGMLTDLVGFLASIYMRGIRFALIPTSVLGMVDASIGGKTAIDVAEAKNILGTISHPLAILLDPSVLTGLPDKQLREGLVEVVKIAAMTDASAFSWLEEHIQEVMKREPQALQACIERAAEMKLAIVERDEREESDRLYLNFGHTVGHAVEILSGFALSHAKTVSMGMMCEMRIGKTEGLDRIQALLETLHLPLTVPREYSCEALWEKMLNDKKTAGGAVRIAVPTQIGSPAIRTVGKEELASALRA